MSAIDAIADTIGSHDEIRQTECEEHTIYPLSLWERAVCHFERSEKSYAVIPAEEPEMWRMVRRLRT